MAMMREHTNKMGQFFAKLCFVNSHIKLRQLLAHPILPLNLMAVIV